MTEDNPWKVEGSGAPLLGKKLAGNPGVLPKSATAEEATPALYTIIRCPKSFAVLLTNACCPEAPAVRRPTGGVPGGRKGAISAGAGVSAKPKLSAPIFVNPVSWRRVIS